MRIFPLLVKAYWKSEKKRIRATVKNVALMVFFLTFNIICILDHPGRTLPPRSILRYCAGIGANILPDGIRTPTFIAESFSLWYDNASIKYVRPPFKVMGSELWSWTLKGDVNLNFYFVIDAIVSIAKFDSNSQPTQADGFDVVCLLAWSVCYLWITIINSWSITVDLINVGKRNIWAKYLYLKEQCTL